MTILDLQQAVVVGPIYEIVFWSAKKTEQDPTRTHILPFVSTPLKQCLGVLGKDFYGYEPASDGVKIDRPLNYPRCICSTIMKKIRCTYCRYSID